MDKKIKKVKFRSITSTLIIVSTSLFVVTILTIGGFEIFFSYNSQKEAITNEQRLISDSTANEVKKFVQEKITLLNSATKFSNLITA